MSSKSQRDYCIQEGKVLDASSVPAMNVFYTIGYTR